MFDGFMQVSFKVQLGNKELMPVESLRFYADEKKLKVIRELTGLPWNVGEDNGLCSDVIPAIEKAWDKLTHDRSVYAPLSLEYGWGFVAGMVARLRPILDRWEDMKRYQPELAVIAKFWIE